MLLARNVHAINDGKATQVDYRGFAQDRVKIKTYLESLSHVSQETFDGRPLPDQLAFLINAYNAWTIELVLTKYPDITSIKDLGSLFQSPWRKRFIPLLGKNRSLDNIEHDLIRGSDRYQDPRIHFAVNCASIGCPALLPRAYIGQHLEQQLEQSTRLFLRDRTRNRFEGNTLKVSAIFKWYREDFEQGWRKTHSIEDFLARYATDLALTSRQKEMLKNKQIPISFLDYDWRLNDRK